MTTWFTADNHFGHENVIKYCDRPFESVAEMDLAMIDNWNSRVESNDTVWHLADLTLGHSDAATFYLGQLNGIINILGNPWHHDRRWLPKNQVLPIRFIIPKKLSHVYIKQPVAVLEIPELTKEDERPQIVVLCHYPFAVWDRKHYGAWHLHGHSHGKHEGKGKILDVGVDVWNFYPVSLEEIVGKLQGEENG